MTFPLFINYILESSPRRNPILIAVVSTLLFASSTTLARTFTVSNTNDSGEGSLRYAIWIADAVDGRDEIVFDPSLLGATITITSAVDIEDSNLSIKGLGQEDLTITSDIVNGDLFNLSNSDVGDFELSDITIEVGESATGKIIYETNMNNISLNRISFIGVFDSDNQGSGPAVSSNAGNITISESTIKNFRNNDSGGAITSLSGNIHTSSSAILNNLANRYGGAIFSYTGDIQITSCTLNDNKSSLGGGIATFALPRGGEGGNITIHDSEINNNSAQHNGGAIFVSGSTLSISDSEINNNQLLFGNNSQGGAAIAVSGDFTISRSTLSNNHSNQASGGAIFSLGLSSSNNGVIRSSTFSNNSTGSSGGAIESRINLTISDSVFSENTATSAGAINSTAGLSISNSLFEENTATSGDGGAILLNASSTDILSINSATMNSNRAAIKGGAISTGTDNLANIDITNSTITSNTSGSSGALYVFSFNEEVVQVNLLNSTLLNNSADTSNQAIEVNSGVELTIINSIIASNAENGGANLIQGAVTTDYSLIGDSANAVITELTDGSNIFEFNPNMLALNDSGGVRIGNNNGQAILTHSLPSGSPLINAGNSSAINTSTISLATDQRGEGFNRIVGSAVDMGAIEHSNAPPHLTETIDDIRITINKGLSVDMSVHFIDPDGDSLLFNANNLPASFNLNTEGLLTGTLTQDDIANLPTTVSLIVSDGTLSITSLFQMNFENQAPVQIDSIQDVNGTVSGAISIDLAGFFSDPEEDALNFSSINLPTSFNLSTEGLLTGTLTQEDIANLPAIVSLTVSDGDFSITTHFQVSFENQAPVQIGTIQDVNGTVSDAISIDLANLFNDPEEDALSFSAINLPASFNLSTEGLLTGTLTQDDIVNLPATVSLIVSDGTLSITSPFQVIFDNQAPVQIGAIQDVNGTVGEAIFVDFADLFSDPEEGSLNFSAQNLPSRLSLSPEGLLTGTLIEDDRNALPIEIILTVSDGDKSVEQTFTLEETSTPAKPTSTSGGGGSMGFEWLGLFSLISLIRRRFQS